ncbi:hypothetical protein BDV93DRAFT_509272 [Ceratobasidium sp. AG-I]|nr:hypothetical protein BDV93DRAFT_509272 [Ceratobasidium sp. AG-I]
MTVQCLWGLFLQFIKRYDDIGAISKNAEIPQKFLHSCVRKQVPEPEPLKCAEFWHAGAEIPQFFRATFLCWCNHYRPTTSAEAVTLGILRKMYMSIGTAKVDMVCPVRKFVEAKPLVRIGTNSEPILYNLLAWWYWQHMSGHERNGLTQMAIDVLSTPVIPYPPDLQYLSNSWGSTSPSDTAPPMTSPQVPPTAPIPIACMAPSLHTGTTLKVIPQIKPILLMWRAGLMKLGILELPAQGPALAKSKGSGKANAKD